MNVSGLCRIVDRDGTSLLELMATHGCLIMTSDNSVQSLYQNLESDDQSLNLIRIS